MHLDLDQEQTRQTRLAYNDRLDVLKKVRKKLEDLGVSTRAVDDAIAVLKGNGGDAGLMAMVDDQTDAFPPHRNGDAPSLAGQMSIDDALDEAGREAARVLVLEKRRALANALGRGDVPAIDLGVPIDAEMMDDQDILTWLLDAWEDVEYVDEGEDAEKDRTWPDIVFHETERGDVVWCAVAGENAVPRFFYGVDPEAFDPTTVSATFEGEALCREVRRAWDVLPEEPELEVRTDNAPDETDPQAEWQLRTCPQAEIDSSTSILLQGIHALLFRSANLAERLFNAHLVGIDDDELASTLSNSLEDKATASVAAESVGGNIEYMSVEVRVDSLTFTMKRGRKREELKGDQAITAIRTMLDIGEPLSDVPAAPESEEELAGVASEDDDDLLPF